MILADFYIYSALPATIPLTIVFANPLRSACHPSSLSIHTSSYLSIPQQHPPTHVVSLVLSLQLFAFSTIQSRSFVGSHFEWAQTKHLAVVGCKFSVASFQISAEAEIPRKVLSKCNICCSQLLRNYIGLSIFLNAKPNWYFIKELKIPYNILESILLTFFHRILSKRYSVT